MAQSISFVYGGSPATSILLPHATAMRGWHCSQEGRAEQARLAAAGAGWTGSYAASSLVAKAAPAAAAAAAAAGFCLAGLRQGQGRPLSVRRPARRKGGRSSSGRAAGSKGARPKGVVFDLDGCLWYPDMYMLWGGGAPFELLPNGSLLDRAGEPVRLHSGVREVLSELSQEERWQGVLVAAASCCDEPKWAYECLSKFPLGEDDKKIGDVISVKEIYKGSKQNHLRRIADAAGCDFEEMIFFDNELYNCQNVSGLGVTCVYCPQGVTKEVWQRAMASFPAPPGEIIDCTPGRW
eukprot:TRINITY_DN42275_c0_g2_i1.p1 TRINITY_DN42275_c0_g2~~TRINITY_DN42275_c0_g2_i1.p1  ORF type:complete len:294 (-),score=46.13 TRINITY_DN42275_c0_g2_i1:45-926(-)